MAQQSPMGYFMLGGVALQPFQLRFDENGLQAERRAAKATDLAVEGPGPCGFSPLGYGCATPAYAEPVVHWDGVHPNTLYSGLIGNAMLEALNGEFGFELGQLSEEALLGNAGF